MHDTITSIYILKLQSARDEAFELHCIFSSTINKHVYAPPLS